MAFYYNNYNNRPYRNAAGSKKSCLAIVDCPISGSGLKQNYYYSYSTTKRNIIDLKVNDTFCIFDFLPKTFTIITNDGSFNFNVEMLKDMSSVISDHLKNPNSLQFNMDIQNKDIMIKFEQIFLGKKVNIVQDDIPPLKQIMRELNISSVPSYFKQEVRTSTWGKPKPPPYDVKIGFQDFSSFISHNFPQTFTIATKKQEYHCYKLGVYSSKLIYELLQKNPDLDHYYYEYDDENCEFQQVCDILNFQAVAITPHNMNIIKDIISDLQIECILDLINEFINEYENLSQAIDDQDDISNSIDEIFENLYHIKGRSIENIKNMIVESSWSKTKESVQELASFFIQVFNVDISLHPFLLDLLILLDKENDDLKILLPFVIKQMEFSFGNSTFNCSFFVNLHKRGLYSEEELKDQLKSIVNKSGTISRPSSGWGTTRKTVSKDQLIWFFPEIYEIFNFDSNKLSSLFGVSQLNYITTFLPDKIEDFKKMRESGEPDNLIAKSLRNDDVDTFQSLVTKVQTDFNKGIVPFTIFESFVKPGETKYIDYAASYGSIKCFKYLLLNHANVNEITFQNALFGANTEIIKIVDQNSPFDMSKKVRVSSWGNKVVNRDDLLIVPSITKHQNDVFDWIIEQKMENVVNLKKILLSLFSISIENGNIHAIISLIDKGFDINDCDRKSVIDFIHSASKHGYYNLLEFLCTILHKKFDEIILTDIFDSDSAVSFGNLSIFKLFIEKLGGVINYEVAFQNAVSKGYKSIIEYIFENGFKEDFQLSNQAVYIALSSSIKSKTAGFFNYLIEQFKIVDPKIFNDFHQFSINLLSEACFGKKIDIAKYIVEMIVDKNPKSDFTLAFYNAASSNSLDICQYLVDKKVKIRFDALSLQVQKLSSVNRDVFSFIIQNSPPEAKEKFLTCFLNEAIRNKNKDLVEYLLNENSFSNDALFEAIKTNDVSIVDFVIKHNSKPSFVNQRGANGTALCESVSNGNIDIIKRLLSIPGIDLNSYNRNNETPLISAIVNYKIEIVNLILDFYGSDITSQAWQIEAGIKYILGKISKANDRNDIMILAIFNRLVEVPGVNLNFHEGKHTLLTYACQINNQNLVELLLKSDRVDPNLYVPSTGDTPLMIAINKKNLEITKLLIDCPRTNINIRNNDKQTALVIAVNIQFQEVIPLLINHEKFDPEESRLDFAFFMSYDMISVLFYSLGNLDVNYKSFKDLKNDKSENSSYASRYGYARKYGTQSSSSSSSSSPVQYINCLNQTILYETTLTRAVTDGRLDKVDLIISHPSFDQYKSDLKAAIFITIQKNNVEMFNKLLSITNNDVNMTDQIGNSILVNASKICSLSIIDEILKNESFDPEKSGINRAFYEIFMSSKQSKFNIINQLYDYDKEHGNLIRFNEVLHTGRTYYTSIVPTTSGIERLVDFCLEHGADPNIHDSNGVYPLEHAMQINSYDFVNALVRSNKIDYSIRCEGQLLYYTGTPSKVSLKNAIKGKKKTYLHLAARSSNSKIFSLLVSSNKIDINSTDELGETPLMDTCRFGRVDNLQYLFSRSDLDYQHCNNEGKDALEICADALRANLNQVNRLKLELIDKTIAEKSIDNKDVYYNLLHKVLSKGAAESNESNSPKTNYATSSWKSNWKNTWGTNKGSATATTSSVWARKTTTLEKNAKTENNDQKNENKEEKYEAEAKDEVKNKIQQLKNYLAKPAGSWAANNLPEPNIQAKASTTDNSAESTDQSMKNGLPKPNIQSSGSNNENELSKIFMKSNASVNKPNNQVSASSAATTSNKWVSAWNKSNLPQPNIQSSTSSTANPSTASNTSKWGSAWTKSSLPQPNNQTSSGNFASPANTSVSNKSENALTQSSLPQPNIQSSTSSTANPSTANNPSKWGSIQTQSSLPQSNIQASACNSVDSFREEKQLDTENSTCTANQNENDREEPRVESNLQENPPQKAARNQKARSVKKKRIRRRKRIEYEYHDYGEEDDVDDGDPFLPISQMQIQRQFDQIIGMNYARQQQFNLLMNQQQAMMQTMQYIPNGNQMLNTNYYNPYQYYGPPVQFTNNSLPKQKKRKK